jgi:hypothetical protein
MSSGSCQQQQLQAPEAHHKVWLVLVECLVEALRHEGVEEGEVRQVHGPGLQHLVGQPPQHRVLHHEGVGVRHVAEGLRGVLLPHVHDVDLWGWWGEGTVSVGVLVLVPVLGAGAVKARCVVLHAVITVPVTL